MSLWRRRRDKESEEGERSVTLARSLMAPSGLQEIFRPATEREEGRRTMIWSEQGKSKAGMGSIYVQGEHDEPGLHNVATIHITPDCNVN